MIEIGKNFFQGLRQTVQNSTLQKRKYSHLANQTEQQLRDLQEDYQARMAYLFRTTSERNQLAYDKARAALAVRQARRAANGMDGTSASAAQDKEQTALAQQAQSAREQQQLQMQASLQTETFQTKWQTLLQQLAQFRKKSKNRGNLSSLGRAVVSLFN